MAIRVPSDARRRAGDDGDDAVLDLPALEAAERGDTSVDFDELWEHREALRNFCRRIVGDQATADDIVQETFIKAFENLDRLERRPSLMPWLTTVARRRAIDELRRRQKATPVDEFAEDDEAGDLGELSDPEERLPASVAIDRVREALGQLNERERRLLIQRVDHGHSLVQLAADDGATVDSVRSVLVRARAKLKDVLVEEGITFRVIAPVLVGGRWLKRHVGTLNARLQRGGPATSTGLERLSELVAVGVVTVALGTTPTATSTEAAPAAAADTASTASAAPSDVQPPAAASTSPADTSSRPSPPSADAIPAPGAATLDHLVPSDDVDDPEDARFDTVAAAPNANGAVLLAAGERRSGCAAGCTVLFRSSDNGATWERLPADGISGTTIAVSPGYPDDPRVFAIGETGLTVSRDGGATFEPVPFATRPGPLALSPGFGVTDELLIAGSSPTWVYDDRSRTARPLAGPVSTATELGFAFAPSDRGLLFTGSTAPGPGDLNAAVYRCHRDLGETVCSTYTVLPELHQEPSVATSSNFASDATVFAWDDGLLLRSHDGGASFAAAGLRSDLHVNGITDDGTGTFFAAVSSVDGRGGGVARSTDAGATWTVLDTGTALDGGAGTVTVARGGTVVAGPLDSAGGGLVCSTDGGATWAPRCRAT